MKPVRLDHDHDQIQRLRPVKLVDLRDYGLAAAAPEVDGHPVLIFQQSDNGTLIPARTQFP